MMRFNVSFFNEQYAGVVLAHFKKQGFVSELVYRVRKREFFVSTYQLTRKKQTP